MGKHAHFAELDDAYISVSAIGAECLWVGQQLHPRPPIAGVTLCLTRRLMDRDARGFRFVPGFQLLQVHPGFSMRRRRLGAAGARRTRLQDVADAVLTS